jgi:spermidine synthase
LASYARPGDAWRFYEINPDVVRVARSAFSYLEDAAASVEVVVGDARLALEREAPQGFDVLVVDAFSGDAIPTHLLTDEAMRLYLRHLAPEGVLAINVSNRHAELPRVVVEHARRLGLGVVSRRTSERYPTLGWYRAHWLLLAARPLVGEAPEGEPVEWTDDFAPVLPILR